MGDLLREPPVLRIETAAPYQAQLEVSRDRERDPDREREDGEINPYDLEVSGGLSMNQWRELGSRSYDSSTTWFDSSTRRQMERAYSHFNSRHAPGSKYFHDAYRLRAQVFRPKTRSMVRRGEAAVAVALFSTADVLDCTPYNDSDPDQRDAAEVAQALLQYRLEHSLPWFVTVVGAAQDAYIHGRPIAMLDWKYRTRSRKRYEADDSGAETGVREIEDEEVLEDRPWIDLIPVENVRFDPDCDWRDPINSSPYVIVKLAMKVMDVKSMIRRANEASPDWYLELGDGEIWAGTGREPNDSIRQARFAGGVDPAQKTEGTKDYETVWIHRCFMRRDEVDYVYDMIGTQRVISIPRPVEEVYPHLDFGFRPLVMGTAAIEAHKPFPASPVNLVDETQVEINELANLKIDAIRHATLGRWLMRRGSNLDVDTLRYAAPNSVIVTDNVNNDVKELRNQDVSSSAFAEDDRLAASFDEVAGNFSLSSVSNNRSMNETVGGMNLLQSDAAQVKEYEIRTFVETFIEPLLNQLYALEQAYETDQYLLEQVCTRTDLPLERVLALLTMKIKIRVNVGFNATSPERRIQRLSLGIQTVQQLAPNEQVPLNVGEVTKEVFGALGYKNGSRFYANGEQKDPEKAAMQQQIAQLQSQLAGGEAQSQSRIKVAEIQMQGRLQVATMQRQTQIELAQLAARIDMGRLKLEELDRQVALQQNEVAKRELILQREALSHEIQQDNREFVMKLVGGGEKGKGKGKGKPAEESQGGGDGPMDLPGEDDAGTMARGDFGLIPYAEG